MKLRFLLFAYVGSLATPSIAQVNNTAAPSEQLIVSPGGVDMRTGHYRYESVDASIGSNDEFGGISLVRTPIEYDLDIQKFEPFNNFTHNWNIQITESLIRHARDYPTAPLHNAPADYKHLPGRTNPDYRMHVHFGRRSDTFDSLSSVGTLQGRLYNIPQNSNANLDFSGERSGPAVYTYTATDGTVVRFRPMSNECSTWMRCAYAEWVEAPDGTRFDLSYNSISVNGVPQTRLSSVVSSRGYALKFFYNAPVVGDISGICAVNTAVDTLPTSYPCPSTSSLNISYVQQANSNGWISLVTKPDGRVEKVELNGNKMAFTKAGGTVPFVTNTLSDGEYVTSQLFADGRSYTYTLTPRRYDDQLRKAGGYYVDSGGNRTDVTFGQILLPRTNPPPGSLPRRYPAPYQLTPGPTHIKDALGRETVMNYCDPTVLTLPVGNGGGCLVTMLQNYVNPDGDKTVLTYNLSSRNVVEVRKIAKVGSGLADLVTTYTYNCVTLKVCAKPTSQTDAKGNVTNYTYDLSHGGVLTETSPAVNGVQPQMRYEYAQRYAWIKNSSGAFVQAATPVWVKTREEYCKTTNATNGNCAGGAADEVVIDFDYGPNGGPNNLLVRGVVVTADGESLRTCYTYDAQGRQISETKPMADLTSCP